MSEAEYLAFCHEIVCVRNYYIKIGSLAASADMLTCKGEIFYRAPPLDKELQTTNDSWEKDN